MRAPTPVQTSAPPPPRETPRQAPPQPSPQQPVQLTMQPAPRPAATEINSTPMRSPPRAPAALRAPPTGPAASRNFTSPVAPIPQHSTPQIPPSGPARDTTSPSIPPSGPRGYIAPSPRGNFTPRNSIGGGGRGINPSSSWGPPNSVSRNNNHPSHLPPRQTSSPTIPTPTGPSSIPTGPRSAGGSISGPSHNGPPSTGVASPSPSTPSISLPPPTGPSAGVNTNRPFNPPTGPALSSPQPPRATLAQNLMSTLPPLLPPGSGGKLDHSMATIDEKDPHYRKMKEDEERLREELKVRQEKLRKSMRVWDRMERESKGCELKSELSERSLRGLSGEGQGGAF
uniref:Uncharacterized protein n=1 Tax=Podospora anserina (strain S / ATCC MYA-4624 / DSM 980 / FGSC 10383) TaxID=515849 RepID=A0A090CLZ1_PODAN|nr:Putative protein of unknown function [Podospora anserina S mat+]